ncbi:hypothetical protein CDAR_190331 [Caerostris darwini]|uniref:Maturase K n=1 Tax=Caerostris darwini TaxID=1538125 RepID=A0AAV4MNC9_9ARAC|nr:hypothetical protein CDAR_190331 [Caerostris darwini]
MILPRIVCSQVGRVLAIIQNDEEKRFSSVMTVGNYFCFSGFCPGRLESSEWALRCLFSVSDVRKSRDFALGRPPLSGTVRNLIFYRYLNMLCFIRTEKINSIIYPLQYIRCSRKFWDKNETSLTINPEKVSPLKQDTLERVSDVIVIRLLQTLSREMQGIRILLLISSRTFSIVIPLPRSSSKLKNIICMSSHAAW